MSVTDNLKEIQKTVPAGVNVVAVSKFHPVEMIMEAYATGQRIFGESRVQEFIEKIKVTPSDIKWHFIGHLQTNKVKQIIGKTSLIESVDSEKLLNLINKESEKAGVVTSVLLQVHVAAEEAKFGFLPEELRVFLNSGRHNEMKFIKICGLMGMATNTDNEDRIKSDFRKIRELFEEIKNNQNIDLPDFKHLSMGMSGDWPLAVEEGADIIRIGSAIFGIRNYNKI